MATQEDAIASLAEDVGRALLAYAERLRDEDTSPRSPALAATHGRQLGRSQQRVLDALVAAGENGLTASEVARQTEISSTNTPRILKALAERRLAEGDDGTPVVWTASRSDD